uniref:Iron-binding zinc finger CDGSH type domain-containing protein n=1 Tax=Salmo trutta TaxID=8032 RepID=A0A673W8P5_SALTR
GNLGYLLLLPAQAPSVTVLTGLKHPASLHDTSLPRRTAPLCCVLIQLSSLSSEPVIASKKPFKVELVGGKRHSWCTCGHSKKQPFCDGTHKTKAQGLMPLRFVPEKDSKAWLCGCKYTANPPYCDGTHKQEFIQSALLPENTDS